MAVLYAFQALVGLKVQSSLCLMQAKRLENKSRSAEARGGLKQEAWSIADTTEIIIKE